MTMTRREQAEMDALRRELAEAKALRWLGVPEPERSVRPPEHGYANGWEFLAYQDGRVEPMWTDSVLHGRGHRNGNGPHGFPASQGSRAFYVTKLDALIALRLAKEREVAAMLARIDRQIEEERARNE